MIAVSTTKTFEYVCECDKDLPREVQTIFTLKPLTAREKALLQNNSGYLNDSGDFAASTGTKNLLAVHLGLQSVDNFNDREGLPVEMKRSNKKLSGIYSPIKDEFLDCLPGGIIEELASVIMDHNNINEDDLKN